MPTNTTIPTKAVNTVLSSTEWNYLTPLNNSIGVLAGTAQSGTLPAVTAPNFQIIAGHATGTTNVSGGLTITLPGGGFPNGLLSAVVCAGDNITNQGVVQIVNASTNKTTIQVNCLTATTPALMNTAAVAVNYIAIGF